MGNVQSVQGQPEEKWHNFREILRRLHAEGIYIHSDQLVEFFLAHGFPVDLCYVPRRLKEKAIFINKHYQGEMARLDKQLDEEYWDFTDMW